MSKETFLFLFFLDLNNEHWPPSDIKVWSWAGGRRRRSGRSSGLSYHTHECVIKVLRNKEGVRPSLNNGNDKNKSESVSVWQCHNILKIRGYEEKTSFKIPLLCKDSDGNTVHSPLHSLLASCVYIRAGSLGKTILTMLSIQYLILEFNNHSLIAQTHNRWNHVSIINIIIISKKKKKRVLSWLLRLCWARIIERSK